MHLNNIRTTNTAFFHLLEPHPIKTVGGGRGGIGHEIDGAIANVGGERLPVRRIERAGIFHHICEPGRGGETQHKLISAVARGSQDGIVRRHEG